MKEVRMYYADTLEDVIGKQFRGQELTFVLLNYAKFTEKDEELATKYIHKQDPGIALGSCEGRQGFSAEVEERQNTYERNRHRDPEPLVAVVLESLPTRARGLTSWLAEFRERAALRKVNALEEGWPSGSEGNVLRLLSYLRHSRPKVRETAALAIGEYLPVIVRASGRTPVVERAVAGLLDAVALETAEPALTNIGVAFGNTPDLVTPAALVAALNGRSPSHIDKVGYGLRLLRSNEYRTELLNALSSLQEPNPM